MRNRKLGGAVRGAIALLGMLLVVLPAVAGTLDDPGGSGMCGGDAQDSTLVPTPVTTSTGTPSDPAITTLLVLSWFTAWLIGY